MIHGCTPSAPSLCVAQSVPKVEILLDGVPVSAEPLEVAPDGKAIPSGVRWFRFPYAPQGTTSPGISVRAVSTP